MSLVQTSRNNTVHRKFSLGHVVLHGSVNFYKRFGIIDAVPEGRWVLLPDIFASWLGGNVSLDQNCITMGDDNDLHIIRIIEGEVGLITDQGVHKLLDEGTHVFNSGTVQLVAVKKYDAQAHFSHGPFHYINVSRGKYAKVWVEVVEDGVKSLVPRLLKEGEHFIKSTFFRYEGLVNVSAEYIGHGSVHILNVLKGQVAKIVQDNVPRCLSEGLHIIETPNFQYDGVENVMESLSINHGTISILQVPRGKVALVWQNNEPFFIDEPGIYEFNSADFKFVEFVDSSTRKIELGSNKAIQVYTGEVGIAYGNGQLKILCSGRHLIESSTHIFERFLSTKQRSIRLISHKNSAKSPKDRDANGEQRPVVSDGQEEDLLVCESVQTSFTRSQTRKSVSSTWTTMS